MASFGERLRAFRKAAGLTQIELGKKVHKSAQVISNLERGYTTGITASDYQSLADALNVPVDELVLDIDSSKGLFQNLGITKDTPPSPTTHFDDPEVEARVSDMMNDPDYQAILYTVKDLSKDELKDLQKIIELYAKKHNMK